MKVVMTDGNKIVTARAEGVYFIDKEEDYTVAVLNYGEMEFTVPIAQIAFLEDDEEDEK